MGSRQKRQFFTFSGQDDYKEEEDEDERFEDEEEEKEQAGYFGSQSFFPQKIA